jgi:hypothetical protein
VSSEDVAFARQPCYHIPYSLDLGQWLCVSSFQMICLYRAKLKRAFLIKTSPLE